MTAVEAAPAPAGLDAVDFRPAAAGERRGRPSRLPLALLALLCLASLGVRAAWLGQPGELVFDENYYVNAARSMVGVRTPADSAYRTAPGFDPNVEHPPLAKAVIGSSIRLFGDRPLGWRAPSLLFGTLALIALYALVRGAGGGPWLALGATAVMASDNLFLVHGRIATLDVFVVAFMLAGAALYLRRHPVLAGVLLGLGACTKLVGLFALPALVLFEVIRATRPRTPGGGGATPDRLATARALGACAGVTVVTFAAVLWWLDVRYTTFRDPVSHTRYMVGYANHLRRRGQHGANVPTAVSGPGIAVASPPWKWLLDREPIVYYQRNTRPAPGRPFRTTLLFQGRISPPVIFLAVPALLAAFALARRGDDVAAIAVAWFTATFLAFVVLDARHHPSYLHYMLVALPGVYLAVARVLAARAVPRAVLPLYGVALLVAMGALYPVRLGALR